MNKSWERVVAERDMLGTQLVKKNGEIAFQEGKMKLMQITLDNGEKQYAQRLDDIRLMRLEITRLRKEKNLLAKGIQSMTDLRMEVFQLERELMQERVKVRALEEALETPLNIHRWRKLQGTDPAAVDLMDKIRILHKELLNKSQKLKESEKLQETVIARPVQKSDPQLLEELRITKQVSRRRLEKIKCLSTELSMREAQLEECRLELKGVGDQARRWHVETRERAEERGARGEEREQ